MSRKDPQKKNGESAETGAKSRAVRRGKCGDTSVARRSSGDSGARSKRQTRSSSDSGGRPKQQTRGKPTTESADGAKLPTQHKNTGSTDSGKGGSVPQRRRDTPAKEQSSQGRRPQRRASTSQTRGNPTRKQANAMVDQQMQTDPPLSTSIRRMFTTPARDHSSFEQLYPSLSPNYSPWNSGKRSSTYESPNEQLRRWSGATAVQTESDAEEDPLYTPMNSRKAPLRDDNRLFLDSFNDTGSGTLPDRVSERELQILEATDALDTLCREIDSPSPKLLPPFSRQGAPASGGWLDVPACCPSVQA